MKSLQVLGMIEVWIWRNTYCKMWEHTQHYHKLWRRSSCQYTYSSTVLITEQKGACVSILLQWILTLQNNIGIKMTQRQRILKVLCGHFSLQTHTMRSIVTISTPQQCLPVRLQMAGAVCFSFTDVHFPLSCSSLCSSNSHVSLAAHSLTAHLPPCWYCENQWPLYSVEGLMSANEILFAMSHPSDSCWDTDKQRPQLFSITHDLTYTNTITFTGTFIHVALMCYERKKTLIIRVAIRMSNARWNWLQQTHLLLATTVQFTWLYSVNSSHSSVARLMSSLLCCGEYCLNLDQIKYLCALNEKSHLQAHSRQGNLKSESMNTTKT